MFQAAGSLYQPQAGLGLAAETGTKIYVSNLDYGVSNEDIKAMVYSSLEMLRCVPILGLSSSIKLSLDFHLSEF
ncbi:hypothetical protein CDL15_Pgr017682 [Punica granatum]|uniref:RRM domain-containing protein n=1 Tax=Punica granatum TaxID=22663 RepID=A0A218WX46_PUNGR|nr:hypothetical protein CDL15_Pgr017682 [Punica granatum]